MSTQQTPDLRHSALVVIDMANDFIYPGGVIADAGGPEYQERARRIIAPLARLVAAARRPGVPAVSATDARTPAGAGLQQWPPPARACTWQAPALRRLPPTPGHGATG